MWAKQLQRNAAIHVDLVPKLTTMFAAAEARKRRSHDALQSASSFDGIRLLARHGLHQQNVRACLHVRAAVCAHAHACSHAHVYACSHAHVYACLCASGRSGLGSLSYASWQPLVCQLAAFSMPAGTQ